MQLSGLTDDFSRSTNRLYERVHQLKADGVDLIDMVRGDVHDAGIVFPQDILAEILEESRGLASRYQPDSLGQSSSRRAIARYEENVPEQVLLTPGTSVSYWYVFRLLANSGDEILCPTPSYPLFDYIARMSGVALESYRLNEAEDWKIDFEHLAAQINPRTRAIVLISPHNPTGMVADRSQLATLGELARRHDVAIIADEVFREFTFDAIEAASPVHEDAPLVFVLNGFSKMFALPGMKIGWISVSGDRELVANAMQTLELISDTFLPVNEIAQFSVPGILEHGQAFLADYRRRVESARNEATRLLGPGRGVLPQGGFYRVVPFGRPLDDEAMAIELLNERHVLVHPGYFYEIESQHLVFSFVGPEDRVREGLGRMRQHLA